MSEENEPRNDPDPDPDPDDEEAWQRLSPRLRGLIREELEEHEKRRTPAPEPKKDEPKKEEPKKEPEAPEDDDHSPAPRPRRSPADVWFGRRA